MFGTRLKTWMENYIGRPKKKVQAEPQKPKPNANRTGGLILDSSESLAHSDTGISSGSQQVLSSSTTDYREGYSTTTMDSDRSALVHCHTAISLPSPESAYSTGYSTDGTSPGAHAPPEYYINIRTGKHYFPSPAPTPTSPHPNTAFPNLHSPHPRPTPSVPPHPSPPVLPTSRPKSPGHPNHPNHHHPLSLSTPPKKTSPRTHCTSLRLFLRSPRLIPKPKADLPTNKLLSPSKPRRWFRQPFHKFANRRPIDPNKHIHLPESLSLLPPPDAAAAAASPRQRNRIKTNPWLPTVPTSSLNSHPPFPLPTLPRNRSCTNTPLRHRKSHHPPPLPSHPSAPLPSSPAVNPLIDLPDRSDDDLTLHEVMGTFNESYVYEKETDILSDSDPTDCDDYDTDSDADNAGDERDSHDDELDFIDNASLTDSDDSFPPNTGKCTYHHLGSNNRYPFLCSPDRRHLRKDSDLRRSLRKGQEPRSRRDRRRQGSRRCPKCDDDDSRKQSEGSSRKAQIDENVGGLNLRRVLLERVLARTGSRGSEGSAAVGRRGRGGEETSGVPVALLDEESDERYKELMEEADNMLESLRNSPVVKLRREVDLLKGGDGRRHKSTEICEGATCCRQLQPSDLSTPARKSPKSLVLTLPVDLARKPPTKSTFKPTSSAHSPLDPLGPTLRNFAVFHPPPPNHTITSSSDDSDPTDTCSPNRPPDPHAAPDSPLAPIAFQSLDLGAPLASYCPQSEPVKRKMYSCSKTYDRLVKHLEQHPAVFEDTQPDHPPPRPLPRPKPSAPNPFT